MRMNTKALKVLSVLCFSLSFSAPSTLPSSAGSPPESRVFSSVIPLLFSWWLTCLFPPSLSLHVCVCASVRLCGRAFVHLCGRGLVRACFHICVHLCVCVRESVRVCVEEREFASVFMHQCVQTCVHVFVCVCLRCYNN